MADQPIRKEAVVAAAAVGLGITYYLVSKSRKCVSFANVWCDPGTVGGLYLNNDVVADAKHWTRERLRSVILAQETPDRNNMHEALAAYIADCDWDASKKKRKGRQVWDSLGKIVTAIFNEYNADNVGFMKG